MLLILVTLLAKLATCTDNDLTVSEGCTDDDYIYGGVWEYAGEYNDRPSWKKHSQGGNVRRIVYILSEQFPSNYIDTSPSWIIESHATNMEDITTENFHARRFGDQGDGSVPPNGGWSTWCNGAWQLKQWTFSTEYAFWGECSWKTGDTQKTIGGQQLMGIEGVSTVFDVYTGFECDDDEILIGFKLFGNDESHEDLDPTEARCCTIGGHSSLTGECTYFKANGVNGENIDEFGNPWVTDGTITNGEAMCNYDGHKVFTGVFDKFVHEDDIYHETKAGKCCEVECDASYCADNQWGVSDECETLEAPLDVVGEFELVCPTNTLLTKVIDGDEGVQDGGIGVQMHHKIVCCKFDIVPPPTFAPSLAPTTEEPTVFPTKAPTPSPTTAPTLSPTPSPTTAPSPSPTPMPTPSPTSPPTFMPTFAPSKAPTTGCETCLSTIYDLEFTERDDFLKAIETCMPECCLEEHIEHKISCDWIAVEESECPTASEAALLPHCSTNMVDGELCEADVTLPNGNPFNVNNCGYEDVFRYDCEQTQCKCADYETEWGACIDSCPDEECEDSYTLNNGQVCRICKVSPDYPSWWTLSAVNMGSGIGFSSLAIVGACSMFYMVTKFVTKREYQYIAEPHEV